MVILEEKLQTIRNKLSSLLVNLIYIYVTKINLIPLQIERIVVGANKLSSFVGGSIQEINEDDLRYATSIGSYVFDNCSGLESVTIPDSVTSIGDRAFYSCYCLTDIYLKSITPPSLGNIYTIPNNTIIHIPIGSGEAYKSATNWSYHSDRIVEDIEI